MSTVAIHAIWTTYLTWPPGDPRGHWSALFDFYGHLIDHGHKLNLPDPLTVDYAIANANEPERILTSEDQVIVANTIADVLHDLKPKVDVYAAAIERTHVHILYAATPHPISQLVGRIKGRTSSEVIAHGSETWRERTWTAGYWKVFLFEEIGVREVQRYVEAHNLRRGLSAAPYAWIKPHVR